MDRRRLLVDAAVALVAFGLSAWVLADAPSEAGVRDADALAFLLVAVFSGSVVLRWRSPVLAVVLGFGAALAYVAADYPPALTPVVLLSVYTAAAVSQDRRSRQLLTGAVAVAALGATLGPGPTNVSVPFIVAGAWLLGRSTRDRRLYTEALEAKNRQLEQAQHDLARQAVNEERLRIARELHDVVAHSLSVVAVHAGTGRMVAARDPAAAERSLETIETTTRTTLREMRQLLGVLRAGNGEGDEPGALGPAPGLADVEALVADVRRSGLDVQLRVRGDRPPVAPGVDLSAYRIVQEALTNVLKHAGASSVAVDVDYGERDVRVRVVDDGRGATSPLTAGHGLTGMRERIGVHGGDLEAGPRPEGGFQVSARLPLGGEG